MYNLCAEIPDSMGGCLEDKLRILNDMRIPAIELKDGVDSTPICEMSGGQLERARNLLIDENKQVAIISSDIDPRDTGRWNLTLRNAMRLGARHINARIPEEASLDCLSSALPELSRMASAYGIPLLIENRRGSAVDSDARLAELEKTSFEHPFYIIWNPMELAALRIHPFFHAYYVSRLKNRIRVLRLNDGLFAPDSPAPLFHGSAELKELISIMLSRSFDGYFSLTPYLGTGDPAGELRGAMAAFAEAVKAM